MALVIGIGKTRSGGATATVPLSALEQDGVPPAQGDSVSFSVDGTVQSVSGDNATLKIDAVDGQPVKASGGNAGAPPDAEESAEGEAPGGPPATPEEEAAEGESSSGPPSTMSSVTKALGRKLRKGAQGRP